MAISAPCASDDITGRPGFPSHVVAASDVLDDTGLAKAYRFESAGWIYVHLEKAPHDIGYQHGYLLGKLPTSTPH